MKKKLSIQIKITFLIEMLYKIICIKRMSMFKNISGRMCFNKINRRGINLDIYTTRIR